MSKISNLINTHCPQGVPFSPLGELCVLSRGRVISKQDLNNNKGNFPVYSSQTENNGIFGYINTFDYDGSYLTWTTDGANAGSIFYHYNKKFSITNVCGLIKNSNPNQINLKFLYYILNIKTKNYVNYGMGNPKLMSHTINQIPIPIPPLEVQLEIVNILDAFTKLEAELEAELEARLKQYNYYLNHLLTFSPTTTPFSPLGEVGTFIRGNGLQKKDFTEQGIGCIHYGQIYTYYGLYTHHTKSFVSEETAKKLKKATKNDIIIAVTSENMNDICKATAWLGDSEIVTGGHSIIFKHKENAKYISYFFQTESFFRQKIKYAHGTKVIDISQSDLKKIPIPIPPLAKQQEIVNILDKFNTLTTDISIGLPAEIAKRKQQYTHYRNKLLTFKELPQ